MRIKFKYNGIIYYPKDLNKKLKKLGITEDDIEVIDDSEKEEIPLELDDTKKYYFTNGKSTIVSIYNNLDNLRNMINVDEYVQCDK